MNRICVYCGSSMGSHPDFSMAAQLLGQKIAKNNIELIYGGANIGLMGVVADAVLVKGGKALGVLPHFLASKEIAHTKLTELILVDTMHERKVKMDELSDGVIALPGGFGTLEELFEMLTWAQLGLHKKPIGILNVRGYYDGLIVLLETMVRNGLLKEENRAMLLVSADIEDLLQQMKTYRAPSTSKWIKK